MSDFCIFSCCLHKISQFMLNNFPLLDRSEERNRLVITESGESVMMLNLNLKYGERME